MRRWVSLGMLLLALTSCDCGRAAPPADPTKEVTCATLERELSKVVDEVVAQQSVIGSSGPTTRLDRESVLKDLNDMTPKALIVTAGDEWKFQNGEFDDAGNRKRLRKAEDLLKDFRAQLPLCTERLFAVHGKQPLTGVRLALLVQLAERRVERVPYEVNKK